MCACEVAMRLLKGEGVAELMGMFSKSIRIDLRCEVDGCRPAAKRDRGKGIGKAKTSAEASSQQCGCLVPTWVRNGALVTLMCLLMGSCEHPGNPKETGRVQVEQN